jgi:biopolymer transport protein ExbB
MLKKLSSVVVLALALASQHFLMSSAYAQDEATAPVLESPLEAAPAETTGDMATAPEAAAPVAEDEAASALDTANEETNAKEQFGLGALWAGPNGVPDWVSRGVLILMVIMSAATWYLTAVKLMVQSSLMGQAKEARRVWDSKSLQDGVNSLKPNS